MSLLLEYCHLYFNGICTLPFTGFRQTKKTKQQIVKKIRYKKRQCGVVLCKNACSHCVLFFIFFYLCTVLGVDLHVSQSKFCTDSQTKEPKVNLWILCWTWRFSPAIVLTEKLYPQPQTNKDQSSASTAAQTQVYIFEELPKKRKSAAAEKQLIQVGEPWNSSHLEQSGGEKQLRGRSRWPSHPNGTTQLWVSLSASIPINPFIHPFLTFFLANV